MPAERGLEPQAAARGFKRPESVLVVIYTRSRECLLLARTEPRGFWQSVTGSLRWGETPAECAAREVREETGLSSDGLYDARREHVFPILSGFSHRYAPGVEENLEHLWYLERPTIEPVRLAPHEHVAFEWLPIAAAIERVASSTNREALQNLEQWTAPRASA
jgi:dihydroneopterin triphosphate diphosphatase